MVPDQVMDAIHFAECVMAKERKDRIGSSQSVVYRERLRGRWYNGGTSLGGAAGQGHMGTVGLECSISSQGDMAP